jgi:hypothetical protein
MNRPNTRQRSWDNYTGDSPIKSREYTDFYKSSERWAPGTTSSLGDAMGEVSGEGEEGILKKKKRKQRRPETQDQMSGYDQMRMLQSPAVPGMGGMLT